MGRKTVVLCDFCEKVVAETACCLCSRDGCGQCLDGYVSLVAVGTGEKSLSAIVKTYLRPGQTVQENVDAEVVHEEAQLVCKECREILRTYLKGKEVNKIMKDAFTALMGRAKAVWAVKAMTGKDINENEDDDDNSPPYTLPGLER